MANGDTVVQQDTSDDSDRQSEEQKFEQDRAQKAAQQNLSGPEAVPEQRPIASQQENPGNEVSDLTKKLEREGVLNTKAMPKSAYDRAASDAQAKKAAANSVYEALKPGDVAEVTEGPHEGRIVAITRVISYRDNKDLAIQQSGRPEANYVQPAEIEGRARGDARDGEILVLGVDEAGLKKVPNYMGTGRG